MSYLLSTDILEVGSEYTFNYELSGIFTAEFSQQELSRLMSSYGDVVNINSSFKSILVNTWNIVVVPKIRTTLQNWLSAFKYSFEQFGLIGGSASFINAVGGEEISPGIISSIAGSIGGTVGTTAGATISKTIEGLFKSTIAIGIIALVAIIFITKK